VDKIRGSYDPETRGVEPNDLKNPITKAWLSCFFSRVFHVSPLGNFARVCCCWAFCGAATAEKFLAAFCGTLYGH
jgi:hypothetical protein